MDLGIAGKVALVTGAGQGVGRQIARDLAAEGAAVVVNDLFAERAEAVAAEIADAGGTAIAAPADITDAAAVDAMAARARTELGAIGILVNNAGIIPERREKGGRTPRFLDADPAEAARIVALNMFGTMNCCRAALPQIVAAGGGSVVMIVSEAARAGEANMAVYSGAKGGIAAFGRALAREHGGDRITVNSVALGAVSHEGIKDGPLHPDATPDTDDLLRRLLSIYPVGRGHGRLSRPDDISGAVLFLASRHARYVTGQTLGVSGGFYMA